MGKIWIAAAAVVAFAAGALAPIEPFKAEATTYEDCLFDHLDAGLSNNAASLTHKACRMKFPPAPKAQGTPAAASPEPYLWRDVVASADFQQASAETREMLRRLYLDWVVLNAYPSIGNDMAREVREKFNARTQSDIDGG